MLLIPYWQAVSFLQNNGQAETFLSFLEGKKKKKKKSPTKKIISFFGTGTRYKFSVLGI